MFSTVRPYLEKIAYIDSDLEGEFASTGFSVLRPGPDILPRFLFYYAISRELLAQVLPHQRGVSYPAVSDRVVKAAVINLPPLGQQEEIVQALEDLLSRLGAAEQYESLARVRSSRLPSAWVSAHLEGIGELTRLADVVVDTRTGWDRGRAFVAESSDNGFPYLKMNNIKSDGRLDLAAVAYVTGDSADADRYRVHQGDVLFNNRNSRELVGKTALAGNQVDGWTYNNNLVRLRFNSSVVSAYAVAQMNGPRFRRIIADIASASTNVAAVYTRDLLQQTIYVPSTERQNQIVEGLNRVRDKSVAAIAAIDTHTSRSRNLRRAVLSAAFSGRLIHNGKLSDSLV